MKMNYKYLQTIDLREMFLTNWHNATSQDFKMIIISPTAPVYISISILFSFIQVHKHINLKTIGNASLDSSMCHIQSKVSNSILVAAIWISVSAFHDPSFIAHPKYPIVIFYQNRYLISTVTTVHKSCSYIFLCIQVIVR